MKQLLYIYFLLLPFVTFSQMDTSMINMELKLEAVLNQLRSAKDDSLKLQINQEYRELLELALEEPSAMTYPFDRLRTMGSVKSPDGLLRVFSWNVEMQDKTQRYFCYFLHYDQRKKEYRISELKQKISRFDRKPQDILSDDNWYGALYYQIVPHKKGSRQMWVLLGWDDYSTTSTRKLIDVVYFTGSSAKLGSPIFRVGKETFKRLFYEHSEKCTMSLRYDPVTKRIIFDHLSPESPGLAGFYQYYVPDMSYDAFIEKGGRWYLQEDVIAVNRGGPKKIEVSYPSDKEGEIRTSRMKNEWINPSNEKAPVAGTPHVARKPGDESENSNKRKNPKESVEDFPKNKGIKHWFKKDKRDPSKMYPYNDLKKKKKRKKR